MSHELRTPLSAVIGYSEMLQEEIEDLGEESLLGDMRKIEANARHLLGLINDVLDLSKIEAERMEIYAETFSVPEVVRDVAATVESLVDKKGNHLTLEIADGLGEARTDQTKLRQCLINLLSNAAKFTEGGRITLAVSRAARDGADWLSFRVTDTGIGMNPSSRPSCSNASPRPTPRPPPLRRDRPRARHHPRLRGDARRAHRGGEPGGGGHHLHAHGARRLRGPEPGGGVRAKPRRPASHERGAGRSRAATSSSSTTTRPPATSSPASWRRTASPSPPPATGARASSAPAS